jgi:glutamine synthetase
MSEKFPLPKAELEAKIAKGEIDTVVVAMCDMQGRLVGKRLDAKYFLSDVLKHGTEGCNYLLAVDVDMNTVPGYAMSSWEKGYSDFAMIPDLNTLRLIPWQPGAALLLADVTWLDHSDVVASPRQILRKQIKALADAGMKAMVGTELEFVVYNNTYEQAFNKGYKDLTPSNQYNVDYSILGGSRIEPLLRAIRLGMSGAGMNVESVKGECNFGQHEIAFKYSDALNSCDNHVIYKNGAKEIAAATGYALPLWLSQIKKRVTLPTSTSPLEVLRMRWLWPMIKIKSMAYQMLVEALLQDRSNIFVSFHCYLHQTLILIRDMCQEALRQLQLGGDEITEHVLFA